MRTITITICLLILCVFWLGISRPSVEGQNVKQKRPNKLDRLSFVPQRDFIVGTVRSKSDGSIKIWSIDDGTVKEILDLGDRVFAVSLAVSNNGALIVTSLLGRNEIACYSLADREWLWKATWVEKGVVGNVMQFSTENRKVVVVGYREIVAYNPLTGAILERQEDSKAFSNDFPGGRTRNNGISPSARYAAFWQGDLEHDEGWWSSGNIWVLVREIDTGKIIAKQGKIQEKYKNCSAAFTPDEKNLVLGSMDGYVRVWSITERRVMKEWGAYGAGEKPVPFGKDPSPNAIHSIIFSPDGRYLATMGHRKGGSAVRIWDYATNKLIHEFADVISSPWGMCSGYPMAFSPDNKYFALEQQGNLCLYDTQTWEEKWCVSSSGGARD